MRARRAQSIHGFYFKVINVTSLLHFKTFIWIFKSNFLFSFLRALCGLRGSIINTRIQIDTEEHPQQINQQINHLKRSARHKNLMNFVAEGEKHDQDKHQEGGFWVIGFRLADCTHNQESQNGVLEEIPLISIGYDMHELADPLG